MKNKKLTLLLLSSFTCVGVSVATITAISQSQNYFLNAEIEPGVVTISASDPNRKMDKGSGYVSFASALNNDFIFCYENIALSEGKYILSGSLYNSNALHGIYQVVINSCKEQNIEIDYGRSNTTERSEPFNLKEGSNTLYFESYSPAYMQFVPGGESFEFTSISFYYTCIVPENEREISEIMAHSFGPFSTNIDSLLAIEGTALNEVDLDKITLITTEHYGYQINMDDVTELTITYNDSSIKESTIVVAGNNSVSISFKYHGWRYFSDNMTLIGYQTYDAIISSVSLSRGEYKIQDNDNIPDNFTITSRYRINLIDSNSDIVSVISNAYISNISVTSEMIVSADEHPFSVYGDHSMTIEYQSNQYPVNYRIYDPSYCNIRGIYLTNTYEVEAGTSKATFLEEISGFDFSINYYEYDSSLPQTTKLNESNFPTLTDNTFSGSSSSVNLDVVYGTYQGTIHFNVHIGKGELIKTYNNTEGVVIMGGFMTCGTIKLYDNDVAELIAKNSSEGGLYQYSKDGTTLIVSVYGNSVKFTVDDVNNTFEEYQSSAQVIREFKTDFSDLGGGTDLYDGTQYDDDTVTFYIMGSSFNCDYTEDTSDDHIIYFEFNAVNCIGTFNEDYSVLTVVKA